MQVEEQQSSPEPVVQQAPQEQPQEQVSEQPQQEQQTEVEVRPNGYQGSDFVEFSPEQQKRLDKLAKKAGKAERDANEWRGVAQQQFELINELRTGQQQIVTHLQTTNFADAETQITTQKQQALERGDIAAYDKLSNDLITLRVQKATAPKVQAQPIQPMMPQQGDFVEAAVQKGAISRDDAQVYREWESETDNYGNSVRGWTNERDPRAQAAALVGKAVFLDPTLRSKPFAEKLKEIDRRMGVQTQNRIGSGVLPSGNLTGNGKTGTVRLSPNQENIAVRTKFAGPGKSSQDHIEAYRKQVQEVRGARK